MDLLETLSQLSAKVAESRGLELVDVEVFRAGRRRVVRIYIGKPAGVSVQDCADMSRDLSVLFDAENLMEDEPYNLEVSSPGLDRPFKNLKDYRRNLGRPVRITCREKVEGSFQHVGKLEEATEEEVVLEVGGARVRLPLSAVAQAKVDIRF